MVSNRKDMILRNWLRALLALCALPFATPLRAADGFYLKNGDTVVFYGDSITDQRLYTTFVETYVVTRFPELRVRFVHSGWGGDRVGGGGGGPVDLRLRRDVVAYRPTVMTIMLGMNDGHYRAYDQATVRRIRRRKPRHRREREGGAARHSHHRDRAVALRRRHAQADVRRRLQRGTGALLVSS